MSPLPAMTSIIDVKFLSPNSYACDWWPELSSALFNIMHGKSKDWGVMPWWYYLSALSKLCLASIPLALLGCCISLRQNERDREMLKVLIGSVTGLVMTLSMVAHKVCVFNCFSTDERSSKLLMTER